MTRERPEVDYEAIAIDTSIFHRYGYQLHKGLLRQLGQFRNSPVFVLISEVVHHEILRHLEERIEQANANVKKMLQDASNDLGVSSWIIDEARRLLLRSITSKELAANRLAEFYELTGAETISVDIVKTEELMQMYFNTLPPFEKSKDKKAEFPDAMALLSLENWARGAKGKVIVVSNDGGWKNYCENSNFLVCKDDLSTALALFQPHTIASNIVAELADLIESRSENDVLNAITDAIKDSVESAGIDPQLSSYYYITDELAAAAYLNHEFINGATGKHPEINVVRVNEKSIVLQLFAEVSCEVSVSYMLSTRDPILRDMIASHRQKSTVETEFVTDVLVTLEGDFSKGLHGIDVTNVELTETLGKVDFGDVEVNWGGED